MYPQSYQASRLEFRERAKKAGLSLDVIETGQSGPDGEPLTMDIAFHAPSEAARCLIHIVGVHGVEGYAGAAIQFQALEELKLTNDLAYYFVHPVNPYGMAWIRRVNANNVDLNRNYRGATFEDPANENYKFWSPYLNPRNIFELYSTVPIAFYAYFRLGHAQSLQAIAQGQYKDDQGLFYGGKENQPELLLFRDWLNKLPEYDQHWVIDVHTGLGKFATESVFLDPVGEDKKEAIAKAYSGELIVPTEENGFYTSYGAFSDMIRETLGPKRLFYIMQEFGTFNEFRVGWNMRAENVFHRTILEKSATPIKDLEHDRKKRFFEIFCPKDPKWREAVLQRGVFRIQEVISYLS